MVSRKKSPKMILSLLSPTPVEKKQNVQTLDYFFKERKSFDLSHLKSILSSIYRCIFEDYYYYIHAENTISA
jgi:hypothetical protein